MLNINDGVSFNNADPHGVEIYHAALQAIYHARLDGQSSGKHSPESWMEETVENQIIHAFNNVSMMYNSEYVYDVDFDIKEAEHALCRLAIAIALYKRHENSRSEMNDIANDLNGIPEGDR